MRKKEYLYFYIFLFSVFALTSCSKDFDKLPIMNSKQLEQTDISSHMEARIVGGKNLVYCSTFQLSWNELKNNIIKEDIKLNQEIDIVSKLNKGLSTKLDIDDKDYVAMVGMKKDNIVQTINTQLVKKFNPSTPKLIDELRNDDDILAYSYLYKSLKFAHKFEIIKNDIVFKDGTKSKNVSAFGLEEYSSNNHQKYRDLVDIIDYKSDLDFIIRLHSNTQSDEIIIANISPQDTLLKTLEMIDNRVKNGKQQSLAERDTLQIPKLSFNLSHSFSELTGKYLSNNNFTKYYISEAKQDITFQLDENGAQLE
ncbi:MAG: hypothetical protein H7Y41_06130, partial [Hyphomonadaceae bacterium]|nr:hypothetical protein [Clostridia bacterium]